MSTVYRWLKAGGPPTHNKPRLLLPELPDDTAQAEAAGLRQRLADWLERRPQFGRDLVGRGAAEPATDAQPGPT
jgi:hypothetical protein